MGAALILAATTALAQRIDINNYGRQEAEGLEAGYTAWTFGRNTSATGRFETSTGDSITLTLTAVEGLNGNGVRTNYWKQGVVNLGYKLLADMANVTELTDPGNSNDCIEITSGSSGLQLTISGLSAGEHTLLAYHNVTDGYSGEVAPLDVVVNGETLATGIKQTIRATSTTSSGMSYVKFTANGTDDVIVQYITKLADGTDYVFTAAVINALVFDEDNPIGVASNPNPSNQDWHVAADDGTYLMTWKGADSAVKHHVYMGTDPNNLQEVAIVTDTTYQASGLYNLNTYYWRIDEETADGTIFSSETWSFRPRHLAFPGAEGYGRFATGGRGGTVYHVTSLADDGSPGTFRYGILNVSGPRTIVFDVSGIIVLNSRLTCSDQFVTIAGQTAPGYGICFRESPFGVGSESIARFLRLRLGLGEIIDSEGHRRTADGIGMAGAKHSILDHTSISWTIDEAFSSRNAWDMTLQRTMLAEALGIAGHKNYAVGKNHGFAASIGGDVGSFHHNLLVDCNGRNWSMAGGLDGAGYYSGRLDIFNNVVYNWHGRTTDGGAHEINFVGNYYKEGPAVDTHCILTLQLEGTGKGSQSVYRKNNIRDNLDGTIDIDANGMYSKQVASSQVVDWDPFPTEPMFPSYATIQEPAEAYKDVLSDVGANQPFFDLHDQRMIRETLNRSYTYVGSLSGIKGEIDSEEDCGGYEVYPEITRADNYDTDQDGMPDWWEELAGTNVSTADNNGDPDMDGYTNLEDYLNWMGEPHVIIEPQAKDTISLKALFAGYTASPTYQIGYSGDKLSTAMLNDTLLVITSNATEGSLEIITLTVTDSEGSTKTRSLGVAVTGNPTASGIQKAITDILDEVVSYEVFNLNGMLLKSERAAKGADIHSQNMQGVGHGTFVLRTKHANGQVHTMKIAR